MKDRIDRMVAITAEDQVSVDGETRRVDLKALREQGIVAIQFDRARLGQVAWCHVDYTGDRRAELGEPASDGLAAAVIEQWRQAGALAERTRQAAVERRAQERRDQARSEQAARVKAASDAEAAKTYADRRREEYPPLPDQLDALWKGGDEAEAMRARIQAIKVKFPKPGDDPPGHPEESRAGQSSARRAPAKNAA